MLTMNLSIDNEKDNLRREIKKYKTILLFITVMTEVAKSFVGKKITRRIETVAKERPELKHLTLFYSDEHSIIKIMMWGDGVEYENRATFFLGYKDRDKGFLTQEGLNSEIERYKSLEQEIRLLEEALSKVVILINEYEAIAKRADMFNKSLQHYKIGYTFPSFETNMPKRK